ncbi:PREDICTED: eukaryotic translation initiation factor 3 subunit F-like [Ipomoea nil]|uniref:eukaryotic translation initiation factor 3 subunit F-like n=1 Tax=Ipomoea nil TaxID=35883 RepID=UPI0009014FF0|nr:PREDICTED: eukaryotic translation initiation factor 3 subunit F-like [Ipomoea nil]XP_019183933.1 PREDICTED: eukaryotic translation initiation factor 3 subunit F-like [Ipomoea nil]
MDQQASNAAVSSERTVSVKLTSRNYLFWRTQLVPFLSGQGLFGFVDGTYPCPSVAPAVAVSPGATVVESVVPDPSVARAAWLQQDQAVLSKLISSLSKEVMHHAVGRTTSRQVWTAIERALGSTTRARILRLLGQLQNLRQGTESVADYLGRAQVIVEDLALGGRHVSLDDKNLYVFRGLRSEYRPLAATLTTGEPVSLTELADFLVAHEFICADDGAVGGPSGPAAMAVQRGGRSGGRNGRGGRGRGQRGRGRG